MGILFIDLRSYNGHQLDSKFNLHFPLFSYAIDFCPVTSIIIIII